MITPETRDFHNEVEFHHRIKWECKALQEVKTDDLTLEQKIGQMMLVGFPSGQIDAHFTELVEGCLAGNIIIFTRNVGGREQLALLLDDIQKRVVKSTSIPAFIAADQEGGMVARLRREATHLPGNMAFSASGTEATYRAGEIAGIELRALGINMNLAPVLDVNNNPRNPGIGVRSYSDDPARVAAYGAAYIRGLQENGVLAAAKHFPGKGDCEVDAHIGLPCIAHGMERLKKVELLPFYRAIGCGVGAVMTSHVLFPSIEKQRLPATMSERIQTDLLQRKMGFGGIRITDCMEMKAIAENFGTVEAAVASIKAGADMVCVCHTLEVQKRCIEAVKKAVSDGTIPGWRIDDAVGRILRAKARYGLFENCAPDLQKVRGVVGCPEHLRFARQVSEKSITLVKDERGLLPVKRGERILTLSTEAVSLTGAEDSGRSEAFCERVKERLGGDSLTIPLEPGSGAIAGIAARTAGYDRVIVATYNAMFNKGQAELVNKILQVNQNVIAVSLRVPYDIIRYSGVPAYLCAYEYTALSVDSVIRVLEGGAAEGRLPVKIDCGREG